MSVLNPLAAFRKTLYGERVDRATATLPQSTDDAIFTVTGGRVLVTALIGEVTTVIGTGTTPELKVKFNPTATGADTDLCAVLNIADDAVGTLYGVTGDYSAALASGLLTLEGPGFGSPFIVSEGDIEIDMDESVTGSVAWTIMYVPLDDGASVAVA